VEIYRHGWIFLTPRSSIFLFAKLKNQNRRIRSRFYAAYMYMHVYMYVCSGMCMGMCVSIYLCNVNICASVCKYIRVIGIQPSRMRARDLEYFQFFRHIVSESISLL